MSLKRIRARGSVRLASLIAVALLAAGVFAVVSAGPAVSPAAAAECFGSFQVTVSPTPVYYNDWSFYKFKYAGSIVRASGAQFLHNGTFFRQVVLSVGGYGWINSAKVRPDPGCR